MAVRDTGGDVDTLLIGVDACSLPIVEPWFEEGRLPNLASIFEGGVHAAMEAQLPPWTASAWPSLYTGVNPGKHGVFDFLRYDGYDWGVVNADDVTEFAVWELLDHHGLSSVVVNVPMTYPPGEIDGAIVPGFTAPEDPECHPPGLLEDLRDELGEYRIYPTPGDDEEHFDEYLECVRLRGEAFRYLVDRFDPAFGFVQFQATDTVIHQYGYEEELIAQVYEAVDDQIGRILEAVDPDATIVASDHGLGEYEGYEFRVNEFLADHGYVETMRGGAGMPSWQVIRDESLREGDDDTMRDPTTIERVVAIASRYGVTTERVGRVLEAVGLDELAKRHAPPGVVKVSDEQVDFPSSRAYMRSRVETGVRINVAGREPEGTVAPEEYEAVRDDLISLLEGVETPDGEPVFDDVARRESYFEGPNLDRAVDVVTIPADWDHFLTAQLSGERFGPPAEAWNHKMEAVVAATGPAVDETAALDDPHLLDVAPTVLSTFDVPYSDRMDGAPLDVVEATGEAPYPEYEREGSRRATDSEAVEDRLENLGYVS